MQLAVDVCIPKLFGGVEGEAIYIGEKCFDFIAAITPCPQALIGGGGKESCLRMHQKSLEF